MLQVFRHLSGWISREFTHPHEVVTGKSFLIIGRVSHPNWLGILKDQFRCLQDLAVFRHVGYVDVTLLNFWCWRNWVLFVDVNDVLRAFRYHTRGWVRRLVHPDEVVTIEALFFRLVLFTNWGIVLNARHVF